MCVRTQCGYRCHTLLLPSAVTSDMLCIQLHNRNPMRIQWYDRLRGPMQPKKCQDREHRSMQV